MGFMVPQRGHMNFSSGAACSSAPHLRHFGAFGGFSVPQAQRCGLDTLGGLKHMIKNISLLFVYSVYSVYFLAVLACFYCTADYKATQLAK
jgi:hypothetical protein